jgi:hypothetical protein
LGAGAKESLAVVGEELQTVLMAGAFRLWIGKRWLVFQLLQHMNHCPKGGGEMAVASFKRTQAPFPQG